MTEQKSKNRNTSLIDTLPLLREARSISIDDCKKYFPHLSGNFENPTGIKFILNQRNKVSEGCFKVLERLNDLRSKGVQLKPNHREMVLSVKSIYGAGVSLSTVANVYKFIDFDIKDEAGSHIERTNACYYFLNTRIDSSDSTKAARGISQNTELLAWLLTAASEIGETSRGFNECLIAIYELSSGFRNAFTSLEVQKRVLTNAGLTVSNTTVSKSKELANRLI